MALAEMQTSVSFIGGVSTKVDPYQIPFNKLAAAKDVIFTSPGEVRTRYGYLKLPRSTKGTDRFTGDPLGDLTTGNALMQYGRELVACDALNLYSWDPGQQLWVQKSACTSVNVTAAAVNQDTYTQSAPDESTATDGTRFDVWNSSQGGLYYSVTNVTTGNQLVPPTLVHADGVKAKVVQIAGFVCLFYIRTDTQQIFLATLPVADVFQSFDTHSFTGIGGTDTTLSTTTSNYDVTVMQTQAGPILYVAYNNNVASTGAGITTVGFIPSNLASPTLGPFVQAGYLPQSIAIFADSVGPDAGISNGPAIGLSDGSDIQVYGISWDLTTQTFYVLVETASEVVPCLSGVSTATNGARRLELFWTVFDSDSDDTLCKKAVIEGTLSVVATPGILRRSVGLAAKVFAVPQGPQLIAYVPLVYQSIFPTTPGFYGLQDTYFVCESTGYIVARFFCGTAGGLPFGATMPPSMDAYGWPMLGEVTGAGSVWRFALLEADFITTFSKTTPAPGTDVSENAVFSQDGVQSVTLDFFNPQESYLRAQLGQTLLLGGGLLQSYDGNVLTENDFNLYPENIADSAVAHTSGGHMPDGTYWFTFVWQWRNRFGELQQSAPGVPFSVTITGGGGNGRVTFDIPTLRMTAKSGVLLMPYRSQLTGTVYNQCIKSTTPAVGTGTDQPVLNDPTVDLIHFEATMTDAELSITPQIYTTGNVVENLPTPPCSDLSVNYNRLFALGTDGTVWYSQQCLPGSPVEMSEWFSLNVDPRGGPATAVRALFQHTIVFKEGLIMAVDGVGPDRTGNQGGFLDAYIITTDVGCIYPRSINLGPKGLYFQSEKGIHLIDGNLGVTYVGADVEGIANELEVTSAQIVSYTQQMRFTLNDGTLIGHDYYVDQWFQHTHINAVDAAIWQGKYCYLQPDGTVLVENPPTKAMTFTEAMKSFTDAGAYYGMSVETPWYDLAGLNGWARTWWVYILGKVFSPCKLRVEIMYDYNESVRQTVYVDIKTPRPFGTGEFGIGPYGGKMPNVSWRVQPNQQLNSAMKLRLTAIQANGIVGEGIALSGLTFWWGRERTPRMPNNSASYG